MQLLRNEIEFSIWYIAICTAGCCCCSILRLSKKVAHNKGLAPFDRSQWPLERALATLLYKLNLVAVCGGACLFWNNRASHQGAHLHTKLLFYSLVSPSPTTAITEPAVHDYRCGLNLCLSKTISTMLPTNNLGNVFEGCGHMTINGGTYTTGGNNQFNLGKGSTSYHENVVGLDVSVTYLPASSTDCFPGSGNTLTASEEVTTPQMPIPGPPAAEACARACSSRGIRYDWSTYPIREANANERYILKVEFREWFDAYVSGDSASRTLRRRGLPTPEVPGVSV
ncbi:hypothetical protein BKA70DRAFT_1285423 [Coprinopsis sp. MPI-PUGE-AT-0042]|nr:hypothetical protein BKA70DRAFT_1285423 [Coprinopsis sp. MPI-PUGE-AT-0042]